MMALAGQSEGKVVYTPTHRVISDGSSFKLHLNADGTTDLTIQNKHYSHCTTDFCSTWQSLVANLPGGNQVVYNVFGAVAMKPGMRIRPKTVWRGGKQNMAVMLGGFGTSGVGGSWVNVKNRYLGVKFKIKGEYHYGWARLSVRVPYRLRLPPRSPATPTRQSPTSGSQLDRRGVQTIPASKNRMRL
jgi:hypothetical protein